MIKLTILSDTHKYHNKLGHLIKPGDLIIFAGDFMDIGDMIQNWSNLENFIEWFNKLNFTHKVMICGNHDIIVQKNKEKFLQYLKTTNIHYLENSYLTLKIKNKDIKLYGSPFLCWK